MIKLFSMRVRTISEALRVVQSMRATWTELAVEHPSHMCTPSHFPAIQDKQKKEEDAAAAAGTKANRLSAGEKP